MPVLCSGSSFHAVTPRSASLLVRVYWPTCSERRGRVPRRWHSRRSGTVPSAPPARTTPLASSVRRPLKMGEVLRSTWRR